MKKIVCVLCAVLCCCAACMAAGKAMSPKELGAFLPAKELSGFTRMTGMEQEIDGMSSAQVIYFSTGAQGQSRTVSFSVIDSISYPDAIAKQTADLKKGDEPVTVKGRYKGRRSKSTDVSGGKLAAYEWSIAGRFLLDIHVSGCDSYADVEKYVELIDCAGLEKAAAK